MIVDIGIAVSKVQNYSWWFGVFTELIRTIQSDPDISIGAICAAGSAMKDMSKNRALELHLAQANTAENRTALTQDFLDRDEAEAIWWIDDDTVPPPGALQALIALDTDVAGGLYHLRQPPYNPVAYLKHPGHAGFMPLWEYQPGEIRAVDSVGMGCTLVKRHVYEAILENYVLFGRVLTHTPKPVHKGDIVKTRRVPVKAGKNIGKVLMDDSGRVLWIEELEPITTKIVHFPFYIMEHERTEDHFFCDMVKRLGFDIKVDTAIECSHWGWKKVTGEHFRRLKRDLADGNTSVKEAQRENT